MNMNHIFSIKNIGTSIQNFIYKKLSTHYTGVI